MSIMFSKLVYSKAMVKTYGSKENDNYCFGVLYCEETYSILGPRIFHISTNKFGIFIAF